MANIIDAGAKRNEYNRLRTWAARACRGAGIALARMAAWIAPWIADEPEPPPRVHTTILGL